MTSDPEYPRRGREWEDAFLAAVNAEAQRRWESGEGSRPGRRTRLAGLANVRLVRDGDQVTLQADVFSPIQDEDPRFEGPSSVTVPITADAWRTPPRSGLAQHTPEVAARELFAHLEIGD